MSNQLSQKTWIIPDPNPEGAQAIGDDLGCSPIIGQVLLNRGVSTTQQASAFFNASLDMLHDPFLIDDMQNATDRIRLAVERHEKILVFGDYDVDGMSGTALLVRELDTLGCPVYYYIPNRLIEGYGLNKEQIANAHTNGVKLIVTVDNGISSHEETALAARLGMDVVVCDHHEPEGTLPSASAVLNPKRRDSTYPFRDLSGAGVALKLLTALLGRLPENLDFAALGTIADIVPLVDENRVLAKAGLEMMNKRELLSPGLEELFKVAGLENREISSGNVAFQLAPRLNAAGRLGVGQLGVQLLLTTSQPLARRLARKLDEENRNRQGIEEDILHQALEKLEKSFDPERDFSIVLSDTRWHPGVTGIVASRLMEIYHRPVILIAMGEEVGKGSARSIRQFHIYEAMSKCREHLVSFGGHKYAAGLTIERSKLDDYKNAFELVCRDQLADEDLNPVVRADAEIMLADITGELLEQLAKLAPHGSANPVPIFVSRGVSVASSVRTLRGEHLKFAVKQTKKTLPVIGFKMAESETVVTNSPQIDILYTPQFNTYRGVTSIQLSLRDVRLHQR
jgi:single-stranded-DNA-specific exonuclease